ncbi:MAG: ABC transporter ATP-binding protein [Euryarchaeota archaeon]|nr:ABC transporter ATP-binding protein [Euryarchaeota archaeon]
MIRIEGLSKQYRMGEVIVDALNNVNLDIREGEFAGIIGPSGGGKTTLLNVIGGIDRQSAGKVFVDGLDLSALKDRELAKYRLEKIGIVFQFFNLIPTLTALENVLLPTYFGINKKEDFEARAVELLRIVGLKMRINHKPGEMSGGEQQRVSIARALINHPKILLLDEPTGNLDSKNSTMIMELLKELNNMGQTILIATHSSYVSSYCTRLIQVMDGRIANP